MKRLFSVMLAICLVMGMANPARAAEYAENESVSEESREEIVSVATLDELTAAIEAADDGDTIAVSQKISIKGENISCDKDITIIRADVFVGGAIFSFEGGTVRGLKFKETLPKPESEKYSADRMINILGEQETNFENCVFDGGYVSTAISVYGCKVRFNNCEFLNCCDSAVLGNPYSIIIAENCYFHDTISWNARGTVQCGGTIILNECIITQNTSVANAGVFCGGKLTISNCEIKGNNATNKYDKVAVDVFCTGTWNITDAAHEDAGFYEVTTGKKIELPVIDSTEIAKLIYLSDIEAAEYFAPAPSPDDDTNIPDEDDNTPEGDEENPKEGEETEDNTNDNPESLPPEETEEPETGDDIINPEDTENQPDTPSDGDNTDDTSEEKTPSGSPQEPSGSDDDNEDNYTPPTSHRPVYRPIKPVVTVPEPEPAPALICGDAVIDTSRSVILEGYGDGLLHLDDNLTRSQMATIIYRLLEADSIEKYDNADSAFEDVAPGAWCCRYVSTIARAGIVCGVGNGLYNPDAPLSWGHIITVLSRFVGAEDYELQNINYNGWALQPIKTAVALGWIEDDASFDPDEIITRGEFMGFVNSVIAEYR